MGRMAGLLAVALLCVVSGAHALQGPSPDEMLKWMADSIYKSKTPDQALQDKYAKAARVVPDAPSPASTLQAKRTPDVEDLQKAFLAPVETIVYKEAAPGKARLPTPIEIKTGDPVKAAEVAPPVNAEMAPPASGDPALSVEKNVQQAKVLGTVDPEPVAKAPPAPLDAKPIGAAQMKSKASAGNGKPSCAVVFSTGSLMNREDGQAIDSNDWVIRQNVPVTEGFEKHVGAKMTHTTVHFGSDAKFYKKGDPSITAIVAPVTTGEMSHFDSMKAKATAMGLKMEMGEYSTDECAVYYGLQQQPDGSHPCDKPMTKERGHDGCICSGGGYAVFWAQRQCSKVEVYGLQQDPCQGWHYWDPPNPSCTSAKPNDATWHNFDLEKQKMKEFAAEGSIVIKSSV